MRQIKLVLKRILPRTLVDEVRTFEEFIRLKREFSVQESRFWKYMARTSSNGASQLESKIVLHAHAIEKGLLHKDFRYGFGTSQIKDLAKAMTQYRMVSPAFMKSKAYQSALSALKQYYEIHVEEKADIHFFTDLLDEELLRQIIETKQQIGGAFDYDPASRVNYRQAFIGLSNQRRSVREFSEEKVAISTVEEAVKIATRSPSVCNRQPARVTITNNPSLIHSALKLQGGFNGFMEPPILALITSDVKAMIFYTERNEAFIDGGLFSMSFLFALESLNLAACPLNTMLDMKSMKKLQAYFHVPAGEESIMLVAIGGFPDSYRVCKSFRYEDEILRIVK